MSLFERIQNKRYDLQEKKKRYQKKVDHGFGDDSGKKTGGFEDITGEGIKKGDYPKTRKELEAKRKEYGINKDGVPSKEGIKRYAEKAKQLKSGSNVPVNVTQDDLDKAKERMVGGKPVLSTGTKGLKDKIGRTTGRYGGRLANKRPKNAPSYAEVKAKIDAKNPVIQTPIGPLPKTAKNMKKFPQPTFKNFVKKTASKGVDKFKSLGFRGKAGVIGGVALGGYLAYQGAKKLLSPATLTNKDFTSTAPIKDRSGQNVRFKYDKKAENIAKPYLTSKSLKKFKSGDYNVATKSGKPINVNQNMKQSAFEKQIQKAQKNPNNKKNQQFLKKFKNATRPT